LKVNFIKTTTATTNSREATRTKSEHHCNTNPKRLKTSGVQPPNLQRTPPCPVVVENQAFAPKIPLW